MKEWFKNNKNLLHVYLYIFISNIILCIFCNFYFRSIDFKEILLLFAVVIVDFILYLKYKVKFKFYFDIIVNFIVGLILMLFYKNLNVILSIFFANNIIFVKSRLSNKFILRSLQYIMMLGYTVINLFLILLLF